MESTEAIHVPHAPNVKMTMLKQRHVPTLLDPAMHLTRDEKRASNGVGM